MASHGSPTMTRSGCLVLAAAVVLLLAACGGDAADTAELLIETQIEEEVALGELTAACNQPEELARGETFECTAITPDGDTIDIVGELTGDDTLNVQTTNLLTVDDVRAILPPIADAVGTEVGATVVAADISCPDRSIILDDAGNFDCEIVDRSKDETYVITIRTGGLDPDTGPEDLSFLIGDLIQP